MRARLLLCCCAALLAAPALTAQIQTPLAIQPFPPPPGQVGAFYSFSFVATGGSQQYQWSAIGALPPGLVLSASGLLSGTPVAGGTFPFTVILSDGQTTTSASFSVTIASSVAIATGSLPPAAVGRAYSAALGATGGAAPYSWFSSGNLPPGVALDLGGTLAGTPTASGTFAFSVTVRDSSGAVATRVFTITVAPPAISISTAALPPATAGQSYSTTLQASGGVAPYRWTATQALPAGLTLAPSGVLSGSPTAAGAFSIPVQVSDAAGITATATLSLNVAAPPLTITTTAPLFNGVVGNPYSQTFSAAGGTPPYTWSFVSGSVPGLSLDTASGVLRGTPTTAGTYPLVVRVTDAARVTASQSYSIPVTLPAVTITAGAPLPNGTVGVPYNQRVNATATGGTPPYTWSMVSDRIPGLTFDPAALILSGVPEAAGTNTMVLEVRDAAGATDRRNFPLTIGPAALSLTSARRLPDGALSAPFSFTVQALGGTPPYRWSANGLPAGVSIDPSSGVISGTPTAAGAFPFAVTVSDATLARVSDLFRLEIRLPAIATATISGLPPNVSAAQQYPLEISIDSPYPAPITGQAIISFAPTAGPVDRTIQFAAGGATADFTIPTGETMATTNVPLAIQTGTVAGTLAITLRLQAGGIDVTPDPAPSISAQLDREAPVVRDVQVSRSGNTINIAVTAFSTAREITQITYKFSAVAGQTLQSSAGSIMVPVESLFTTWFQDLNNAQYGSVFIYTQPFTIQGDTNAVTPTSVTLTNRVGSTDYEIRP
jgi:hypothetical protein